MGATEKRLLLIACLALSFSATSLATTTVPDAASMARRVADRYGASAFHRVDAIHYVFKVRYDGKETAREWTWYPKDDSVAFKGKDAGGAMIQASYSRRNKWSMGSDAVKGVDKMFINDQYWLLFPLHLAWDTGTKQEVAALPHNDAGEAYRLTVTYPAEGGYTPGDAYDLFIDVDGVIKRWIFRRANSPKPTREALWTEPKAMGPLGISMERPSPGKDGFKLWFENVRVDAD
jgi:hypothetical protein